MVSKHPAQPCTTRISQEFYVGIAVRRAYTLRGACDGVLICAAWRTVQVAFQQLNWISTWKLAFPKLTCLISSQIRLPAVKWRFKSEHVSFDH